MEPSKDRQARIFVVATPIGNLDDLSPRARQVLASADMIAAEDTRQTSKLLSLCDLPRKELVSYHDHNEHQRAVQLIERLKQEALTLALVSDAGTPCVSDPGYRLINEAHRQGISVHAIPGPSALTALISIAGLPCDQVLFMGFLPTKANAQLTTIRNWKALSGSVVFLESTRRLITTLKRIDTEIPDTTVAVGRELTKLHEQLVRGSCQEVIGELEAMDVLKGEATVMVSIPKGAGVMDRDSLVIDIEKKLADGATMKELLQHFCDCGLARNDLYQLILTVKSAPKNS